jgi:hypothetical protein
LKFKNPDQEFGTSFGTRASVSVDFPPLKS